MVKDFQEIISADGAKASLTAAFVFAYMTFHLGSVFLSGMCIILIASSFPVTAIITEGIFGITYFGDVHNIIIFIIMGVAADDIFVFVDAWRQSASIPELENDLYKRMYYTFRRAFRAMAVTSSTTSVAFFSNLLSPLMPIKSFGLFAGVIIPVNFFLVITFLPSYIIIHEKNLIFKNVKHCQKKENKI
jgi:protein dispatched 1